MILFEVCRHCFGRIIWTGHDYATYETIRLSRYTRTSYYLKSVNCPKRPVKKNTSGQRYNHEGTGKLAILHNLK